MIPIATPDVVGVLQLLTSLGIVFAAGKLVQRVTTLDEAVRNLTHRLDSIERKMYGEIE